MASLANQTISSTYDGLVKTSTDQPVGVSGVQLLEDGVGNSLALSVGRANQGVTVTGPLTGTLSATSVLADGVIATTQATSDNSTKVATTAYVKSVVTAEDLDIAGDSGTGAVDLDSQTLTIEGTANEIETSASGQTITIGLPSTITANVTGDVTGDVTGNVSGNVTGDVTGNLTGTVLTAAQANITSVGTLSSLAVSGNLTVDTNTLFVDAANNRVGVGTTTPDNAFHVFSGAAGEVARFTGAIKNRGLAIRSETNVDASALVVFNSRSGGNKGTFTFETDSTERMRITSGGNVGIGVSPSANFRLDVETNTPYAGNFKTVSTAVFANVLQANLLSDVAGQNCFFTSSFRSASTDWSHLKGNYDQDGTPETAYIIYGNGNIVNRNNSYGGISDAKLKENVVNASPKLDSLLQVKVRNFNYIGSDKKQLGVVAQELEEVFPSMIDESPDYEEAEVTDEEGNVTTKRVKTGTKTKSVKYSVFVPMLIKAIQELNAKVESLEAQLNA